MRLVKRSCPPAYKSQQKKQGGMISGTVADRFRPNSFAVVDNNSSLIQGIQTQLYKIII
jgi:hypothetical protein